MNEVPVKELLIVIRHCVLGCLLGGAALCARAEIPLTPWTSGTTCRVLIEQGQAPVKEFIASLTFDARGVVFVSTTKADMRLVPEKATTQPAFLSGAYRAFVQDRPLFYSGTPVTVKENGADYIIETPNNISIRLIRLTVPETPIVTDWQSSFLSGTTAMESISKLKSRLVSPFGAGRSSFRVKHLHTGVDLKGSWSEAVFPVGEGVVEFVSYWEFESTVLIRHRLANGQAVFSKYIHVRDPKVRAGDLVAKTSVLARLFTKAEFKRSGFGHNHLHLEIRKDYSDHGHASTRSQSQDDLSKCCIDPLVFLSLDHR